MCPPYWEIGINIYTRQCIKWITDENLLYSPGNSVFYGDLHGKEIQKRGDICINLADSLCCMAETNTTFKNSYIPIKINLKKWSNTNRQIIDDML